MAKTVEQQLLVRVMLDVLDRIGVVPLEEMRERALAAPPPRDSLSALTSPGCGVIAVIKRATPAGDQISEITSVPDLAREFAAGGACMLACHTDQRRFQGSLEDLRAARQAVDLPVVCRDIIVDPYQVHEARAYGADMVPLQIELLEDNRLLALRDRIESLGMAAMFEVRSVADARRAVSFGPRIIGINARGLGDFAINRGLFSEIVPLLPEDTVRIALSGVRSPREQLGYARAGADAVMIGRTLLNSDTPGRLTEKLVAAGQHPATPRRRFRFLR